MGPRDARPHPPPLTTARSGANGRDDGYAVVAPVGAGRIARLP